jgi:hypothetical protein
VAGHVFVSYSRGDGEYVAALVKHMRAQGLTVWTDQGVSVGARWVREIERQILDCAAFVPVMSERSRDANWVDREIDLAEEQQKPIAPLLLTGRPFFRLRHLQYEDVRAGNMPSGEFLAGVRVMIEEGRQVPLYRGTAPGPPVSAGRPPWQQSRWLPPVLGLALFLLFFVGTFLTLRSIDRDDGLGVAVGSCVVKGADSRLVAARCGSEGALPVTQIAPAGRRCDNPADIQHLFVTAGRPAVCVSSGR